MTIKLKITKSNKIFDITQTTLLFYCRRKIVYNLCLNNGCSWATHDMNTVVNEILIPET